MNLLEIYFTADGTRRSGPDLILLLDRSRGLASFPGARRSNRRLQDGFD